MVARVRESAERVQGISLRALTHTSWLGMRNRCTYEKDVSYASYGGAGITICDRWLNSFDAFVADMGLRPSRSHSLDRIDNTGNYEPNNCRWSTAAEQSMNSRSAKLCAASACLMRHMYARHADASDIAYAFGVSKLTVMRVVTRESWRAAFNGFPEGEANV